MHIIHAHTRIYAYVARRVEPVGDKMAEVAAIYINKCIRIHIPQHACMHAAYMYDFTNGAYLTGQGWSVGENMAEVVCACIRAYKLHTNKYIQHMHTDLAGLFGAIRQDMAEMATARAPAHVGSRHQQLKVHLIVVVKTVSK